MQRRTGLAVALCTCLMGSWINASAAVTRADYERAAGLREKYKGLALNIADSPMWIEGTDNFVYNKTAEGGHQFVLVDAVTANKKPAFDHARLAAALSKASGKEYKAEALPFVRFRYVDKQAAIEFRVDEDRWRCDLAAYTCKKLNRPGQGEEGLDGGFDDGFHASARNVNNPDNTKTSPDKKWLAYVTNYNIVVRSADGKQTSVLSTDGSEGDFYSADTIVWSPDSTHLVAYRIRPGYHRMVQYIDSSPATQLQPLYVSVPYTKAGDVLDLQQPVLFDVAGKRQFNIDNQLFPNPFDLSEPVWWKDSRGFTFEYNQRGHQVYRVIEVDAKTGVARSIVSEESTTFIEYRPLVMNQQDTGKVYRYDIADGKEMIWASERDGWEHLYLLNDKTGKVENQITKGNWAVRAVNYVDEKKRQIWFEASGMNPGEDPYLVHGYRINFDGTSMTPLPEAPGNHHLEYSPDGKYYVDTWSTISEAPTMALYQTDGNKQIAVLERGDISKLIAAGWHAPEVITAKGRDGKTDIWGVIYKPANFDANKKYPVIEDIYAGPQGSFVPKSFTARAEPLTELGFVVVQIDGMGTNNRSKAFHDVAWKNLKDAGFPDRILWHKAAAQKFPWYDISNVGIFGTSAGGQSAMGALLFHPEFYKVAVSNSGCHDNRMDKIWWNEQWMGWPIGPQYSESSNVDNAYRLQGKLMLVVGEMDKNVDPSSTFQVVDRLIKAGKTFDLLYVPGGGHGAGGEYGQRKLEDFFVHNILRQEPPDWNAATGAH